LAAQEQKSEAEKKREKQKELSNVEDVWRAGYADGVQINYLFIGLVRAGDWKPIR